ncbi:MAG: cofactor-independent phosphoglycerate mutase [Candidatus Omnitrophica bacterium]|nr:cofactor-independent phosphoglycerate mutase [Candidatus Omnitrophota bacterium]
MKYVLVIPDGMGDKPLASLGGKTPLEAARTPNMDFFAAHGVVGLSQNIPDGFTPGTDIGCMSVFGYDPKIYFTGRGPLEAAELGIALEKDDLAFRCNLVTAEGGVLKDFSAGHVSVAEARILIEVLGERLREKHGERFRFYPGGGTGYRNLFIYHKADPGMARIVSTPPHDIMGRAYRDYLPKGKGTDFLAALMTESREILENHPVNEKRAENGKARANLIWLWGQGVPPHFPSYHKRFGFQGAVITAVDLLKGIAIHAGLDVIAVPGVTGYFDTNYTGKAEYAVNVLRSRDFVAVHVESTDEAGHMGDAALKIRAIEDVDRWVLGTLREKLKEFEAFKILILPDHYTCVETRTHSPDPVPFLIYSSREEKRGPRKFCEKTAAESKIFVKEGHTLMNLFVKGGVLPS